MLGADGSPVTVTFDEDPAVVETLTGGPGGPDRGHHHDRRGDTSGGASDGTTGDATGS